MKCRGGVFFRLKLEMSSFHFCITFYSLSLVLASVVLGINIYIPYFASCKKTWKTKFSAEIATMVLEALVYMNIWTGIYHILIFFFFFFFDQISYWSRFKSPFLGVTTTYWGNTYISFKENYFLSNPSQLVKTKNHQRYVHFADRGVCAALRRLYCPGVRWTWIPGVTTRSRKLNHFTFFIC